MTIVTVPQKKYSILIVLITPLVLALSVLTFSAYAASATNKIFNKTPIKTLDLSHETSGKDILEYIHYFADAHGNQNIDDIITDHTLFTPLAKRQPTFNVRTHWYRVNIKNKHKQKKEWYFSTGVATAHLLRAYWVSKDGIKTLVSITSTADFNHRAIKTTSIVIPVELAAEETGELYIENRSIANYPLRIKPYEKPDFQKRLISYTLINGTIFGSIIMLLIFFLIQLATQPSRMLAYYCLYILSTLLFISQVLGFNFQILWPNNGAFNNLFTSIIGSITYFWYFLFVSELFELKNKNLRLYRIIMAMTIITFIMTVIGCFTDTSYAMSLVALVGLPIPVFVGLWAIREKLPSAYFFCTGSVIHCGLAYLLIVVALGINFGPTDYLFNIVSGGQIVDLIIISMAIAYQTKKLREQLNQHLQQRINDMESLVTAEKEKSHFLSQSERYILSLASTTHDITQPLASIRLTLATLDDDKSLAAKQHIETTLNYTTQLIRSVLKDSQTDYNELHKQIDLKELFKGLQTRHQAFFDAKALDLRFHSPELCFLGYPMLINRILDNLISNGLRYTHKGGLVVSARRRTNDLLIQVCDTGKGMPKHQVKKLLEPFEQLNQKELDNAGYGLGLYIVKTLCDKAGYQLIIKSNESKGSCFSILIPNALSQLPL